MSENFFSEAKIKDTFMNYFMNSTTTGKDNINGLKYTEILDNEVDIISRKIANGSYKFSSYKENLIIKNSYTLPRILSIPTLRDRIVLKILFEILSINSQISLKLPNQLIEEVINFYNLKSNTHFIKFDLVNFYSSIPHDNLIIKIKNIIPEYHTRKLIISAIKNIKRDTAIGIPQGLSISNVLAEIYINEFDNWFIKKFPNCKYFRYVDDILIFCNGNDIEPIIDQSTHYLNNNLKLTIHPIDNSQSDAKSTFNKLETNFSFLGYNFQKGKVSVRLSSIHKIEQKIASICTQTKYDIENVKKRYRGQPTELKWHTQRKIRKCEWLINLTITGCIYQRKRFGWVFYFSKINDTSALRRLDSSVNKILEKFKFDLDSPIKIKTKRFLKSFYTIKDSRNPSKYIIDFDRIEKNKQKKIDFLSIFYDPKDLHMKNDDEIDILFKKRVIKYSNDLLQDIGSSY